MKNFIERMINSKARIGILSLFFSFPQKEFYARQIVEKTKLDPSNTHNELLNLTESGILKIIKKEEKKFYAINRDCDYYEGLRIIFEKYQQELDLEKWFVIEEMPETNAMVTFWMSYRYNKKRLSKELGIENFIRILNIFEKGVSFTCLHRGEMDKMSREIFNKLINDPNLGIKANQEIIKRIDDWTKISTKIYNSELGKLKNKELFKLFIDHYEKYRKAIIPALVTNLMDYDSSMFSKYLLNILKDKKEKLKLNISIGEVFSVLTTPKGESLFQKEHKDLLKILDEIYPDKKLTGIFQKKDVRIIREEIKNNFLKINHLINGHQKKYGWLSYKYEGPGWGVDYFIDILASLARQRINPHKAIREIIKKEKDTERKREIYIKEFRLNLKEKNLFKVATEAVYAKAYRKDRTFYGIYCRDFLFREICKRRYLSMKQIRYVYPDEFKDLIFKGNVNYNELNARYQYHLFYTDNNGDEIISGDRARKFLKRFNFIQRSMDDIRQLDGDTASPGKIRGVAKIINVVKDMDKIKEGDVLVSLATNPDLIPAIKKSAAIVTDMGGITCHAAIVSRELGIPCVVGTKIATKIIKDGDILDVDASHGRVTIIKKAEEGN